MASDKKSGAGKFALGALIGAAVGTVAGILTAPKSGKETRDDIKRKAGEAKDAAGEKAEDLKRKAGDHIESAKKAIKREEKKLKDMVEEEDED